MFQQEPQSKGLALNQSHAATGEEHLWGIVSQWATYPASSEWREKTAKQLSLQNIHPCDHYKTIIN